MRSGRLGVFEDRGSRLHALGALGQSVWLDSISREMLRSGELERYVEAGISGVTSNPTIFAKAMLSGDSYDAQIDELVARDADVDEIYTAVVTRDIRQACERHGAHPSPGRRSGRIRIGRGVTRVGPRCGGNGRRGARLG